MAIIKSNSDEIIIDATLTQRGRDLLLKGDGSFKIAKFAVSDDGINYNLWDPDKAEEEAGLLIENTPLRQASVNGNVELKNKLMSFDNPSTVYMAKITNIDNITNLTLDSGDSQILEPKTEPINDDSGYVCTITDTDAAWVEVLNSNNTFNTASSNGNVSINPVSDIPNQSSNRSGNTFTTDSGTGNGYLFKIHAKNINENKEFSIIITGKDTGASHTINCTTKKYVNPIAPQQQEER